MSAVLDSVLNDISDSQKVQLSQQLGVKTEDLQRGMEAAIPVLLGGMEISANDPEHAGALEYAVQKHGVGSLEDILGSVLGAQTAGSKPSVLPPGGEILNDIFGAKRKNVEQNLGKASGLDAATMGQLLKVLGPLVLGALAKQASQPSSKSKDLGSVLKEERTQMEKRHPQGKTLLGMFLDQDGDGDFDFNDAIKLGFSFFFSKR